MAASEGSGHQPGSTWSDLSGSAGDVVQARDIAGGIHFYSSTSANPGEGAVPVPSQLPADVRGFVNRVADLERMDQIHGPREGDQAPARVCVLTGTAGVGKTSLAVHWGHRVADQFPDGQLYVNLRGYDPGEPVTAGQALERFLIALGIAPAALPEDVETRSGLYRSLLAHRRLLIVLDNAATVKQVRPLLPGAGRCLVLVTSRSRLSGLVARNGAHRLDLDLFDEPAAINLLYGTVAGYRCGDSEHEIAELARLCARLPLALRIAAERAAVRPHMPMGELIANLRDESHLWSALSAEDDDEADAVRTVFAWSYRALPPDVARMFRLLGLHPGPEFSIHAAAALAALPVREAGQLLDTLVGAHLLEQISHDRYQFHDLLRAYATDQVHHDETADNREAAITRILTWYEHTLDNCLTKIPIRLVESVERIPSSELPVGVQPGTFTDSDAALAWFDMERANVVECVRLAVRTGNDELAWHIPAHLRTAFYRVNAFDDWVLTAELGLGAARRLNNYAAEALLLNSLCMYYRNTHQLDKAEEAGRNALALFREIDHRRGEAVSLNMLALVNALARRFRNAIGYLDEAQTKCEISDYRDVLILARVNRPRIYIWSGNPQQAYDHATATLDIVREAGNPLAEIDLLASLMRAAHLLGRHDEAVRWAESALSMSKPKMNDGQILIYYGHIQQDQGNFESALDTYHRAVVLERQQGDRNKEAEALDATGSIYKQLDRSDEAAKFHLGAISLYRSINNKWGAAVALDHLAHALTDLENHDAAVQHWNEALSLIEEFDDPEASALRDSIRLSQQQFSSPAQEPDRPHDSQSTLDN